MCATVYFRGSEDNLWELVFFFHQVGLRDGTQVLMLGGEHLFPPSLLTEALPDSQCMLPLKCVLEQYIEIVSHFLNVFI